MRFPSVRRLKTLYIVMVGVLSLLIYAVAYWATRSPGQPSRVESSGRSAVGERAIPPSPPVYDTVSALKQDR